MRVLNDEYKRPCPVCGTPIHAGLLMCRSDWRKVPPDLQREVNESWQALNRRNVASVGEARERAARYRLAAEAAVDAANGRAV
jgi:hypothetical protein